MVASDARKIWDREGYQRHLGPEITDLGNHSANRKQSPGNDVKQLGKKPSKGDKHSKTIDTSLSRTNFITIIHSRVISDGLR
jgi:hypothetical protein